MATITVSETRPRWHPLGRDHLAGIAGSPGTNDGTGTAAQFNLPDGIAVDSPGTLYVADGQNFTIRKITSGGLVTTLAGLASSSGSGDGSGSLARFTFPSGVAIDSGGMLYVSDSFNFTIRRITSAAWSRRQRDWQGPAAVRTAPGVLRGLTTRPMLPWIALPIFILLITTTTLSEK